MKKLLSIAVTTALLSTVAMAISTVGGTIGAKAVVGFSSVAAASYHPSQSGTFIDAPVTIASFTGDTLNDLYVKTNINPTQAVKIDLGASNNGNLRDTATGALIPVTYKLGTALVSVPFTFNGIAQILTNTANTGATPLANTKFIISPNNPALVPVAGTYSEDLTFTITAQ